MNRRARAPRSLAEDGGHRIDLILDQPAACRAAADVGVAMGAGGATVSSEAAMPCCWWTGLTLLQSFHALLPLIFIVFHVHVRISIHFVQLARILLGRIEPVC